MSSKQSKAPSTVSSESVDDFSLIRGIGPAFAGQLHKAGIHTFRELASMSPVKLSARVMNLSTSQVARQDWIVQARRLASKKKMPPKVDKKETTVSSTRQHYQNFTFEVLLGGNNKARRTRVVHIQSGDADTWPDWKPEQLIDFLARHSQLTVSPKKPAAYVTDTTHNNTLQDPTLESTATVVKTPGCHPVLSTVPRLSPTSIETNGALSKSPGPAEITSTLRLQNLMVSFPDSQIPISFIRQGEPYCIRLTLDPSHVIAPTDRPLRYEAKIIIKQVGGSYESIRESRDTLSLSGSTTLSITGSSLPPGTYRLESIVRLVSENAISPGNAFLEGGLLQVY